ncbi:MAG: DsbC family protein [Pseudomonadota bacterium]
MKPKHSATSRSALAAQGLLKPVLLTLSLIAGFVGLNGYAEDEKDDKAGDAALGQALVNKLMALRPGLTVDSVSPTPVPGVVGLNLPDGSIYYGTEDGQYLFSGDLFQLGKQDLVNLTEAYRSERRKDMIADIAQQKMVTFAPEGKKKAALYVFTDVDCGYCRKLHQEVPELNAMGVEVNYLAYPRAGIGSDSYNKIVSAWCNDDPNAAITALKSGALVPNATCTNPVAAQYELGQQIGISGTPAILLEDGRLIPGYRPAKDLAETLGI